MAHFAKIGLNNKVMSVHSVHNNELLDADGVEQENIGIEFLTNLHGWAIWKQTSYNTIGGVHKLGGTPLRKNHAAIGYTYNEDKDAFIAPKPYSSWTLNDTTCLWEAPVAYPDDENIYTWNEDIVNWEQI